jgi:integrase
MARVRRNANLGSRDARRALQVRPEPYFMTLEPNLALGYRKAPRGAGSWLMKRNVPMPPDAEHKKSWRSRPERSLGIADDYRDADGTEVLNFAQAQRMALERAEQSALRSNGQLYTVGEAVRDYVEFLRQHRKSAEDSAAKLRTYALPLLGERRVAELAPADFEGWLDWAIKRRRKLKKPRLDGDGVKHTAPSADELAERQRRRKATLNRVITALKACLNHAHVAGKVPSREAWARLRKFRSADSARLRWLTVREAQRLQNAAAPDIRPLVTAALLTGCRAGELLALRAGDFDPHSKTVLIAESKSGKPRRVPLTDEGVTLFANLTAGRLESERLFTRADGTSWYRMAIARAMREACSGGKVSPAASFHTLRHTYASHLVQKGVPLLFVASALGHSDARMVEKHYGHLAPSQVADMIREKLPSFGSYRRSKVRSLAG